MKGFLAKQKQHDKSWIVLYLQSRGYTSFFFPPQLSVDKNSSRSRQCFSQIPICLHWLALKRRSAFWACLRLSFPVFLCGVVQTFLVDFCTEFCNSCLFVTVSYHQTTLSSFEIVFFIYFGGEKTLKKKVTRNHKFARRSQAWVSPDM